MRLKDHQEWLDRLDEVPGVNQRMAQVMAAEVGTDDLKARSCKIPWSQNLSQRLVKAPKVHLVDTGLACHLLGADARRLAEDRPLLGRLLESYVVGELRKQGGRTIDTELGDGGQSPGDRFAHVRSITMPSLRLLDLRRFQGATPPPADRRRKPSAIR